MEVFYQAHFLEGYEKISEHKRRQELFFISCITIGVSSGVAATAIGESHFKIRRLFSETLRGPVQ